MIRIRNLWKRYNGLTVLKGIDLEVIKGETLVILGRSGAGKSVLLRQIMGIEKPDEGSIEIEGKDIVPLQRAELYSAVKEMGMLFQASALFDSMTVEENVAFYLKEHGEVSDKEMRERVEEALALVALEGKNLLLPSDLSGGMRKRAALARLIVYKPKILLYDEPTTGLDPITAMQINDLILQTGEKINATSIVVTHDLCSAFHIADRIALNHDGKIAYSANKEDFVHIKDPLVESFLKNSIPELP